MHLHDPVRQVSFVQQALSQNRKPIGFFLGAGCPLSVRVTTSDSEATHSLPLIPDVAGLTEVIASQLAGKECKETKSSPSPWDIIVQIAKDDGMGGSNIELLLSKIRTLRSVAGSGSVRGLKAEQLEALDRDICSVISKEVDKALPTEDTPYHDLAVWARSISRDHPIHVFTTNYDLLMEQAMEESAAPYFDGFIGTRKAFFDLGAVENESLLPARWTRLWKMHGSLNWCLDGRGAVVRGEGGATGTSYLIYPSHLKYDQSRKMPFLAMLDRLKSFLLKPSALLVICGYSFADEHINDVICRSLETNSTAHVFALLYGELEDPKYKHAIECAKSTPNLSLLAFDAAIIGRNPGGWRSDETDELSMLEKVIQRTESSVSVRLGDFAALGSLLRGLSGVLGPQNDS